MKLIILTNFGKDIIQSRYSLSIVLLCFWGALNFCCMIQLSKQTKAKRELVTLITLNSHNTKLAKNYEIIQFIFSTYIADILEELANKYLEGLLLVLRLCRHNSVKVIAEILSLETQIILNIWPSLLVYQLLHINNVLG